MAIMRSSDPRVQLVRREFVTASRTKAFRDLFGTTGNVRGALFSHGTHELRAEQADAESYIGDKLSTALSQYDSLFTLTPQTDAPTGSEGDSHVWPPSSPPPPRLVYTPVSQAGVQTCPVAPFSAGA